MTRTTRSSVGGSWFLARVAALCGAWLLFAALGCARESALEGVGVGLTFTHNYDAGVEEDASGADAASLDGGDGAADGAAGDGGDASADARVDARADAARSRQTDGGWAPRGRERQRFRRFCSREQLDPNDRDAFNQYQCERCLEDCEERIPVCECERAYDAAQSRALYAVCCGIAGGDWRFDDWHIDPANGEPMCRFTHYEGPLASYCALPSTPANAGDVYWTCIDGLAAQGSPVGVDFEEDLFDACLNQYEQCAERCFEEYPLD